MIRDLLQVPDVNEFPQNEKWLTQKLPAIGGYLSSQLDN